MFKKTPKILNKIWGWAKSHRWKFGIILAIIFFGILFLPKRITAFVKGPEAKYQITTVKKGDLLKTVSASGQIEAQQQVNLKFQSSGLLSWVGVKEGDTVKKWQAIASLDRRELEKTLTKALRDYSKERNDFDQEKDDYKDDIITDSIKRILEKNQWDLDKAVLDVELKDIILKFATLISPIDGIVTSIDTPIAGINVTPATAVFTIANPQTIIFRAEVDEADIASVTENQEVLISLDAYPDEQIKGTISRVDFQAVTTSGGGTAFEVEVVLEQNLNNRYKLGMNGDLEIIIEKKESVISVPANAVYRKNNMPSVKILQGRIVKEMPVETGLDNDSEIEIITGLTEGEKVITGEKK